MTANSTVSSVGKKTIRKHTTAHGWLFSTKTPYGGSFSSTMISMTSSYDPIATGHTSIRKPEIDPGERWRNILSFAGVWENSGEMTVKDLDDLRSSAWGSHLDDFDDTEKPDRHS